MADEGGHGISEKELTCAICTEILYQPLTLLDCLHTFCGACLKEWFKWQATSAAHNRRTRTPYTCPSCRESVRRTKADWRLTTLLEGFLKANPDKAKTEQEKEELVKTYKTGEDVLPPVQQRAVQDDSDDERLLAEVRELSMAEVDPETARRRAERSTQHSRRQEQYSPEALGRRQQPSRWAVQQTQLTESRLREREATQPQIEHQPSLRSLLSVSDADPQDVQADILRSIYADGLLEGIDLDNLTIEQEEELTERIAEAYRRRQRRRERSGDREGRQRADRSPRSTTLGVESQTVEPASRGVESQTDQPVSREGESQVVQPASRDVSSEQQQPRSRPPISRPHLFEQSLQDPSRTHRRSRSSTSQQSDRSDTRNEGQAPASRSATDLSQQPSMENSQRERRGQLSYAGRSITDPEAGSIPGQTNQSRSHNSSTLREGNIARPSSSGIHGVQATRRQTVPTNQEPTLSSTPRSPPHLEPAHTVRHEVSRSAFAPEPVPDQSDSQIASAVKCNHCSRSEIQYELHYNCRWCLGGAFNICIACYRAGHGCYHWFGFGFRAFERWYRTAETQHWPIGFDRPHILTPRRFVKASDTKTQSQQSGDDVLYEGAFCESCLSFTDDCYWYCNVCLEGAWGFCDKCVKQGRHCTHPLLVVAHINTTLGGVYDPTKLSFVGLPHLRQDSYVNLPLSTACDICHQPVLPNYARFHCYQCNEGDYDICSDCYRSLVSQGKISEANGSKGWRRCLKGHRMTVIDFQATAEGGHLRRTVRELVGGWALKEDETSRAQIPSSGLPPEGGVGMKCLAIYNWFPSEGVADEIAFPKNAEIREVEDKNGDWYVGVYAGVVGLFPSNHVRIL